MEIRSRALALVLLFGTYGTSQATPFVNPSFEEGSLDGWQTVGDASIQTAAIGSPPTQGEYDALLAVNHYGSYSGVRMSFDSRFFNSLGFPLYFAPAVTPFSLPADVRPNYPNEA